MRRSGSPATICEILLIGHAGHEEVEGTTGEAPEHITASCSHPMTSIGSRFAIRARLAWLSQTT